MKIKLIKQRGNNDCVIACIAMVAKLTYDQARIQFIEFIGDEALISHGAGLEEEVGFLKFLGLKPVVKRYPRLEYGKISLITVPSLNYTAINHRIVVNALDKNNLVVLDPSRKKQYKTTNDIKGYTEVVTIKEKL